MNPPTSTVFEPPILAIEDVTNPVILNYFETLNAGNFKATSQMFAAEGQLLPPFEEPVIGAAAIATYLDTEAQGLKAHPKRGKTTPLDHGCTEYQIGGKVDTALFSVNVRWTFILNPDQTIDQVTVKLLASLEELSRLRR